MTKVEQLKARAYTIVRVEEMIEAMKEENKKAEEDKENLMDWEVERIEDNKEKIRMMEFIIEEIAK